MSTILRKSSLRRPFRFRDIPHMMDAHDRQEKREYREHLTRWLQARRDFRGLDVGDEPHCPNPRLREEITREFNRTF